MLGEADDRTEKEERCYIFRNRQRIAKETIHGCCSTQHFILKYKIYWISSRVFASLKKNLHFYRNSSILQIEKY